jgi:hypothetical protein
MYIAGAVIGQLPFTFLFPMFPMNYTIPALEVGWGIFTLLQYRAQGFGELMAYRFFVGIFEVFVHPNFPSILAYDGIGSFLSRSSLRLRCLVPWG